MPACRQARRRTGDSLSSWGASIGDRTEESMIRLCPQCNRQFTPHDFYKEESRGMEAERRAFGLEGVRFLYYHCPDCHTDDIFIDLHSLEDESPYGFQQRRADL